MLTAVRSLLMAVKSAKMKLSEMVALEPGDVIVTGTTGGVGAYFKPPKWLKPGDTVDVEVTGVGVLRNPVIAES